MIVNIAQLMPPSCPRKRHSENTETPFDLCYDPHARRFTSPKTEKSRSREASWKLLLCFVVIVSLFFSSDSNSLCFIWPTKKFPLKLLCNGLTQCSPVSAELLLTKRTSEVMMTLFANKLIRIRAVKKISDWLACWNHIVILTTEGVIKVCTWLREISSCSCLTVLPGPAWVLLIKTCSPLLTPLYTHSG